MRQVYLGDFKDVTSKFENDRREVTESMFLKVCPLK